MSQHVIAQVKAQVQKVGAPVIRETYGIATAVTKQAAVYALAGYTAEARRFADDTSVALFIFDLEGEPLPLNSAAEDLLLEPHKTERSSEGISRFLWEVPILGAPLAASFCCDSEMSVVVLTTKALTAFNWDGEMLFSADTKLNDNSYLTHFLNEDKWLWGEAYNPDRHSSTISRYYKDGTNASCTFAGNIGVMVCGTSNSLWVTSDESALRRLSLDGRQQYWTDVFLPRTNELSRLSVESWTEWRRLNQQSIESWERIVIWRASSQLSQVAMVDKASLETIWVTGFSAAISTLRAPLRAPAIASCFHGTGLHELGVFPCDSGLIALDLQTGDICWKVPMMTPPHDCLKATDGFLAISDSEIICVDGNGNVRWSRASDLSSPFIEADGHLFVGEPTGRTSQVLTSRGTLENVATGSAEKSNDAIRLYEFGHVLCVNNYRVGLALIHQGHILACGI